jgi:hypothetical protein
MSFKIDCVEGIGAFADMNSNEKLRSPVEVAIRPPISSIAPRTSAPILACCSRAIQRSQGFVQAEADRRYHDRVLARTSSARQSSPRSLLVSWWTPWNITLRSSPNGLSKVMMERLGRKDADTVQKEIKPFDAARA